MKHTILIERWKREACEVVIDAKTTKEAEEQALALYMNGDIEHEFVDYDEDADYKDEELSIYKASTNALIKAMPINSERNIFK